jgi:lipoate-protein ligase A
VTYCLVIDDSVSAARRAPAKLYRLVHECWRDAIAADGPQTELAPDSLPFPAPRGGPFFCFEKPGRTDLILDGAKVLGSAQRRIPGRVLQHGSLLLGRRFAAHPGADLGQPPGEEVEHWIEAFLTRLAAALSLELRPTTWSAAELADAEQRRARYSSEAWTRRL